MNIQRLRKASSILVLGILIGVSLSPAAAGLLVCTAGIAPHCCRDAEGAHPSSSDGRGPSASPSCGCCLVLDAPSALDASLQKSLLDSMAGSADLDEGVILSSEPIARAMAGISRETGPSASRSPTLRI